MFMLNNNRNSKSQMVFTMIITVLAILTLGMIKFSATPRADHSYDAVERMHASRSFTHVSNLSSYDPIENIRAKRTLKPAGSSYDILEQLRNTHGLSADRAYDNVEEARALRNNVFSVVSFGYDQIESLRIQREVSSVAVNSGYDLIEQLRASRGLHADRSYDLIETLRLQP